MRRLLFILVLTLTIVNCIAQDEAYYAMKDTSTFNAKIGRVAKETKTIQSDFVQEKHMSFLSEPAITKGRFFFKKENKVRWEYNDPYSYIMVMNDGKISIKDGDKEKKFDIKSRVIANKINEMMLGTIQGKVLNNEDFEGKFLESADYFLVRLVPVVKKMKKYVQKIDLYFDKENYHVSRIKIVEISGDYTLLNFMNRVSNGNISEERFTIN